MYVNKLEPHERNLEPILRIGSKVETRPSSFFSGSTRTRVNDSPAVAVFLYCYTVTNLLYHRDKFEKRLFLCSAAD
jgi:hypothetical protein